VIGSVSSIESETQYYMDKESLMILMLLVTHGIAHQLSQSKQPFTPNHKRCNGFSTLKNLSGHEIIALKKSGTYLWLHLYNNHLLTASKLKYQI
jgi:hypothetical protein